MLTRRRLLATSLGLSASALFGFSGSSQAIIPISNWRMPDESEAHTRTWMAFGASAAIWGKELLPETRRSLALLANTIVKYEPVSMLVREKEYSLAASMLDPKVNLVVAPLNDVWIRDTGPSFVLDDQGKKGETQFQWLGQKAGASIG